MYPDPNIDPNKKDKSFMLNYAKQAWRDSVSNSTSTGIASSIFYGASQKYETLKKYALGKQDKSKYGLPYVDKDGKTFATGLDLTIRPVISKYRDIAISKLQQRQYNIVATPIDALAKDETEKFFNEAKVKIMMRDMAKQANPELLDSPQLRQEPGEAEDLEELDMQKDYTYKHNMAMEAEMAWELVADMNDFPEERNLTITNWYDYGVGGYKEWNDENGNTRLRAINPANVICSRSVRADFKDCTHFGEVIEVNVGELAGIFTKEELDIIRNANDQNAYRPTATFGTKEKSKVYVLDLEFISTDEMVFSQRVNSKGNLVFGRDKYEYKRKDTKVIIDGKEVPKFSTRKIEQVYKCKWIIGTDFVYDEGLATNQKRDKSNLAKACLSYHLYAFNFYNMVAVGVMERLVPTLDEYQETVVKIRNFKNKWIPYIIDIDMDALENVALGQGGQTMKPMELLDMMWQTNVMLSRKRDGSTGNINYKSVDVQATPMAGEFSVLIADLSRLLQEISDLSGFNQLTDGSTPNAKTLVPVANSAIDATNNSQYPIIRADKNVNARLAKGCIQRVQAALKSGKTVKGVIKDALGSNTEKFWQASQDFQKYEIGIMVEDRPTNQEWSMLIQDLNLKDAQGQVDPSVKVMIRNCRSLKQAEMLLAFHVKKKRDKDQQQAMMMQQQNGQIQIQSAQAAEKAKQETLQVEYQLKAQLELKLKEMDMEIQRMKIEGANQAAQSTAGMKLAGTMMQQDHDERKTKIQQGITVPELTPQPMMEEAPMEQMAEQPEEQLI